MNSILRKYLDKFIVFFINKTLIYSKIKQEHEKHLTIILHVLREQWLFANFSKCNFFKNTIQYLGHVVSKYGISVSLDKIKAITEWHVPNNVTDIRSFTGITGYY